VKQRQTPVGVAVGIKSSPKVDKKQQAQVAKAIVKEKQALQQVKTIAVTSRSPAQKAQADKETAVRQQRLAKLVTVSKQLRGTDKPRKPATMPVAPVVARIRQAEVGKRLEERKADLKALQQQSKKATPKQKKALQVVIAQKIKEVKHCQDRQKKLAKGQDLYRPPKLASHQVKKPRVRLALPPAHIKPTKPVMDRLIRQIAIRVPRRPGQTIPQYRAVLYALAERAATRWSQYATSAVSSGTGFIPPQGDIGPQFDQATGEVLVNQAVDQTIQQDEEVVEQEVESGGVAEDPTAEQLEEVVDESGDVLEQVVEAADPSLEVEAEGEIAQQSEDLGFSVEEAQASVDTLLNQHVAQDAALAQAQSNLANPEHPQHQAYKDAMAAFDVEGMWSLLQQEAGLPQTASPVSNVTNTLAKPAVPFYKQPVVIAGVVAAAVGAFLYFRRR
jgi:hypothetical protein